MTVRTAMPEDEEEIMAMCRALHRENGLMPLSEPKVRAVIHSAVMRQGPTIGVIGETGALQGMICMLFSQMWCSDDWHLEELFSYVPPEHRKSNNAKDLVEFAKRCADELGLPLIIGVLSNGRTEAKVRLYQRMLQKPVGAFFVYGTKWNPARRPRKAA